MKTITPEDLVGVWENQNVAPFIKNKKLYITFFIGDNFISITNESEKNRTESIAIGDFKIKQGENDNFSFIIDDDNEVKIINCRMFMGGKKSSFVAKMEISGDIYMERQQKLSVFRNYKIEDF